MTKLISWVEIPTTDFERAVKFYNQVLNLELEPLDFGSEKMACFPNDEGAIIWAEGYQPSNQGAIISFYTKNMESSLEKVWDLGGKVTKQKTKIEADGRGYFAHFTDCEGNRIGLYSDN